MITEEEPCLLDVEIQSLKAIFAEELQVNRPDENGAAVKSLVLQMTPESSKGENVQFVRFEIILEIPSEYPQALPKITLRNVRGLSEEAQTRTKEDMMKRAAELSGTAMLFELIQVAKEQFTSENTPSIPCSICLFSFDSEDSFSRTPCFHFFHTYCLANHVQHTLAQTDSSEDKGPLNESSKEDSQDVLCPVCRLSIPFKESDPEKFPVPRESLKESADSVLTPELREMQQKMATLYSQQLAKGGIINLEAEKNKFFIEISNTPDIPVLSSSSVSPSSAKQTQSASSTTDVQSVENTPENIRKHQSSYPRKNQGPNPNRPYVKGQYRKLGWQNENSDSKSGEVKKKSNWESDDDSEQNKVTASPRKSYPFKRYSKREGQRFNDRTSEGSYRKVSEGQDEENEDGQIENFEGVEDKRGGQRSQFHDKRQKFKRGSTNGNEGSHIKDNPDSTEIKLDNENEGLEGQDPSNTKTRYKSNFKKKYRRPRNYDVNDVNQDQSAATNTEDVGDKGVLTASEGEQLKSQNVHEESSKNNIRTSVNVDRNMQPRNYRNNYNRYDNRANTKRFYKDKRSQSNDGRNETTESDQINNQNNEASDVNKQENADQFEADNQAASGEQYENRVRNNNNRYKNNMSGRNRYRESGTRGRNYRNFRNTYNDSHGQQEDLENSRNTDSKSVDISKGPQEELQYSEGPLESTESNYRPRTQDNSYRRNYNNPRTNRRYQRNNVSSNEFSEVHKETDTYNREDSNENSANNEKSRYGNRHDNYRKEEHPRYNQDNYENRSTSWSSPYPQEPNMKENARYDQDDRFSRGNFRQYGNRKQRYGNSRPDFGKGPQPVEPATSKEETCSDPMVLAQSGYSEQSSEVHKDDMGRKSNDSRTNRRDTSYNNNWKGRNSHQRYSYQQSKVKSMSQGNADAAASSSRTDPSSLRPNIKPFTLMYNSTTPDAQTLVCIPPPF